MKSKKNRDMTSERLNINYPGKEKSSMFKFEDEILMLRATIRRYGISLNPCREMILIFIDGYQLHPDLINSYLGADPKPVFITYEDEKLYNDISNWNIPKL